MKNILFSTILLLGLTNFLSAQVFDLIVAKDGSGNFTTIQEAVDAAPDDVRTTIFIKNGIYQEKVMIGSHSKASKKLLSIIGEDAEKVIITWDDYNGKVVDGKTMGGTDCGTFIVSAVDFYAENITIQNPYTKAQAIALYSAGDRQTYKNCRLVGWQDTHRLRKGRRYYFSGCYIEGAVDYIYSGGPAIFDNCQLHTVRDGGYIVAPEDVPYIKTVDGKRYIYCFVFRNSLLTTEGSNQYYLGRPWGSDAGAVFIDSKTQGVKKEGWNIMGNSTYLSSFFAEYNSMDLEGNPLDVSNRIDWSYQLTKEEIDTYYTPEIIYSFVSGNAFDPFTIVIAPEKPLNLAVSANLMSWTAVDGAKGYIIYEDESIIGFSETPEFNFTTSSEKTYSVKAVGGNGNLSEAGKVGDISGISNIKPDEMKVYVKDGILHLPENAKSEIFSISGLLIKTTNSDKEINLKSLPKGVYFVKAITNTGSVYSTKISL